MTTPRPVLWFLGLALMANEVLLGGDPWLGVQFVWGSAPVEIQSTDA